MENRNTLLLKRYLEVLPIPSSFPLHSGWHDVFVHLFCISLKTSSCLHDIKLRIRWIKWRLQFKTRWLLCGLEIHLNKFIHFTFQVWDRIYLKQDVTEHFYRNSVSFGSFHLPPLQPRFFCSIPASQAFSDSHDQLYGRHHFHVILLGRPKGYNRMLKSKCWHSMALLALKRIISTTINCSKEIPP